jgi:hypothetical protein
MLYITIVHIYWLKGGLWPGNNYQDLVDKVLGSGNKLPSFYIFIIVIIIFLLMALFPVLVYFDISFIGYKKEMFLFFSIVFFIRSFYMFIPFIANKVTKVFLELNKKIYAPICLALSISYFYLYVTM